MAEKNDINQKKRKPVIEVVSVPEKRLKIMGWLMLGTGIAAILYWILFYATNIFYISGVEGFEEFRKTFIFGGIWFIIMAITAGSTVLLKKEDSLAYGALTGATLIFGGLVNTRFFFAHKLYNHISFAGIFEGLAVLFSLIFGGYIATKLWNKRDLIIVPKEGWSLPPLKKKKRKK